MHENEKMFTGKRCNLSSQGDRGLRWGMQTQHAKKSTKTFPLEMEDDLHKALK